MATADIKEADDEIADSTKSPFLRRVRIRGYKSIAFCDVTLEPLTVLVGRNASGKSNFLDALAFLRDAVKINVTEAVKRHGGWANISCRTTGGTPISFELEFDNSASDESGCRVNYFLEVWGRPQVAARITRETFEFLGGGHSQCNKYSRYQSLHGPENPAWATPILRGDAQLDLAVRSDQSAISVVVETPFNAIAAGIRKMSFQNIEPNEIRGPKVVSGGSYLEKSGSNLASVIRSLKEADGESLSRVKQYVTHIVEEVSDFWVQPYGEYETVRFRMRSEGAGKSLEFDADSMSDGTLRVLANVMAAFQNIYGAPSLVPDYGHPSVVGIEEPETALHPAAMNALVDALDEATMHTQILLTTHSAELLDNPTIKPENVRVVELIDGRSVIGPLDSASIEIVQRKLDTLGGLERQNQFAVDIDDRERQGRVAENGQERHE